MGKPRKPQQKITAGPKPEPAAQPEAALDAAARPVHGLARPASRPPYGVERLRRAMKLSAEVALDRLCEEAAQIIEAIPAPPPDWLDRADREHKLRHW